MKVDVKKVDATKRELRFVVPKERVAQKMEEVYSEIAKVAKVKGFRQGKVPRHILETQHAKTAQEETIQKIIPEVYQEGVEKEKIKPMDHPEIHDVSFKDGIISFTAKLDIRPEVKIKNYKKIKVKRKSSQVTDEEIEKTFDYFKKGPSGAEGKDEKKDIKIDDEFARGMGFPSLEEFKTSLRRQMEIEKDRQNRFDVESQILDSVLNQSSLVVPKSVVERQLEHRVADTKKRFKSQGMSDDEIKEKEPQWRKEFAKIAEKDVKTFLVLEKIAELENIHVHQGENLPQKVIEFLLKEAEWEEAK